MKLKIGDSRMSKKYGKEVEITGFGISRLDGWFYFKSNVEENAGLSHLYFEEPLKPGYYHGLNNKYYYYTPMTKESFNRITQKGIPLDKLKQ